MLLKPTGRKADNHFDDDSPYRPKEMRVAKRVSNRPGIELQKSSIDSLNYESRVVIDNY